MKEDERVRKSGLAIRLFIARGALAASNGMPFDLIRTAKGSVQQKGLSLSIPRITPSFVHTVLFSAGSGNTYEF